MINYAGENISHNYPVLSVTPNVGSKYIPNCHVVLTIHSVGRNYFRPCLVKSKTVNAGKKLLQELGNLLSIKLNKKSMKRKDLWIKRENNSVKSTMMLKNLQKIRPQRLNSTQWTKHNKLNQKPNKQRITWLQLQFQQLQEQNSS